MLQCYTRGWLLPPIAGPVSHLPTLLMDGVVLCLCWSNKHSLVSHCLSPNLYKGLQWRQLSYQVLVMSFHCALVWIVTSVSVHRQFGRVRPAPHGRSRHDRMGSLGQQGCSVSLYCAVVLLCSVCLMSCPSSSFREEPRTWQHHLVQTRWIPHGASWTQTMLVHRWASSVYSPLNSASTCIGIRRFLV